MALDRFRAPPLPNPPQQWDAQYMRQFLRAVEVYFSQLDSRTPNNAEQYSADRFVGGSFSGTAINATSVITTTLDAIGGSVDNLYSHAVSADYVNAYNLQASNAEITSLMTDKVYGGEFYGDGRWLEVPYNQFQSDQDQTAANVATAYAVTMNQDDFPNGITLVSNSQITVSAEGVYLVNISIQFQNDTNDTETVDVWFRKNGTNIPASNSQFSLPARKSAGTPSSLIAAVPFMVDLAVNDYIQIMWRPSVTTVTIQALPAVTASPGVTPAIPATPSVLVNIGFISAQHPLVTRVAPLPVFGFGQVGTISVVIR
jgi:hypothetical protein